jgi:hypothetical protein
VGGIHHIVNLAHFGSRKAPGPGWCKDGANGTPQVPHFAALPDRQGQRECPGCSRWAEFVRQAGSPPADLPVDQWGHAGGAEADGAVSDLDPSEPADREELVRQLERAHIDMESADTSTSVFAGQRAHAFEMILGGDVANGRALLDSVDLWADRMYAKDAARDAERMLIHADAALRVIPKEEVERVRKRDQQIQALSAQLTAGEITGAEFARRLTELTA